jgi:xanthine/uracil permease
VLGGITLVLYGMIGLLGAKIWIENGVDFANPVNLVPLAAGLIAGIGNVTLKFTDDFSITGIALGTIIALVGYHVVRWLAPAHLREEPQVRGRAYEGGAMISAGNIETPEGEISPFHVDEGGPRRE